MKLYDQNANMRLKDIFVQNLRKYRKFKGISQMTLAERCGTSTSYIGQIEIGNRFPSLEMIEKIAKTLDIMPYLLFLDESEGDTTDKIPKIKKDKMSNAEKEELIKRLTSAIRRIVKQTK
jgi:transcriptional regulator with XRE-family HTH domain